MKTNEFMLKGSRAGMLVWIGLTISMIWAAATGGQIPAAVSILAAGSNVLLYAEMICDMKMRMRGEKR